MIDLTKMKMLQFEGEEGVTVVEAEIPEAHQADAEAARQDMLESLSMYSDEMMELLLSGEPVSEELIDSVVRKSVQALELTPVYMGTAFKNKGVQPLLDRVVQFLPSPLEREINAKDYEDPDKAYELTPDPKKPFVGMAFKIVDDPFGQLTFMRL